jgi:hypothetical protein
MARRATSQGLDVAFLGAILRRMAPDALVLERLETLLAGKVESAVAIEGGYTPAARWLLSLRSGTRVFVKMGTTRMTAEALRREALVYHRLTDALAPRLLAWEDDGDHPLLVLEDLSGSCWPPPWNDRLVGLVVEALHRVHHHRVELPPFREVHGDVAMGWQVVADDPAPFLNLALTSREWLERSLPKLVEASSRVDTNGDSLTHFDVRSDNLCLAERGVLLVDWNNACLGSDVLDTGFWLPSLEAEGGPKPEQILPGRPEVAAAVSGFFAARAGQPEIMDAPRVRWVQRQQLAPALRWVVRALGLEEP